MQSTESLLNITFNSSLQTYGGDLAVGSMTIISSTMQMMMMPMMGLAQGAQPIMSFNYGAKQNDRVKQTFKLLFICAMAYALSYWAMVMFLPQLPISIFTNDPVLKSATIRYLRIYMAAGLFMGAQAVCQQTFVAIGQAKVSLFIALLRKIILLIPLILIMPNFFTDKVFAVFLSEPIADFIAAVVTVSIFAYRFPKVLRANTNEEL